ncbi:SRPBCC family protein [Haloferax sp. DFSO60]|uniref:SRPBCC family protein n=1 Tax=Haloferax sp. DFSO60 TaxID=3388652 RepID=UPI00397C306C
MVGGYGGIRTRLETTPDGRRLVVSRVISASPERCWSLVTNVEYWTEWGPSVSAVRGVSGRIEPGSTGEVRVAGVWVPFTIETCEKHRWTWRVAGIPATGHRVRSWGVDSSLVSFELPVAAAPYAVVCAVALERIDRLAQRGD